ncbi:MAG: hypothetical protein ACI30R_08900, partial [Sodaliphilus sp.]
RSRARQHARLKEAVSSRAVLSFKLPKIVYLHSQIAKSRDYFIRFMPQKKANVFNSKAVLESLNDSAMHQISHLARFGTFFSIITN